MKYVSVVEDATGTPYRAGNDVSILQNGDEIFPALLEAVRHAEHSIEFLSYVFWRSHIARQFADALIERARAGVEVRLLVDAVGGASISARTIWLLERAGVKVGWFRPGYWKYLRRLNHRTHRKILLVDGRVGFTGGVGIADQWAGVGQDEQHWRETHCRIAGPACADMYAAFAVSWLEATGETLKRPHSLEPAGDVAVHTTISTAGPRPTAAEQLVGAVFAATTERLWISSAYFVPGSAIIAGLATAAVRGVDVRVLTNGPSTNHRITRLAGRASYEALLEAGVKIYEYQPTVHHAKVMTADGAWATIGSTNLDPRSLVLNDELNVSFTDRDLVASLDDQFLEDLQQSELMTPVLWAQRSRLDRLAESGAALFADQL
jgi:cardiolipin synthase